VQGAIAAKLETVLSDPEPTADEARALQRAFTRYLIRVDEGAVEGERLLRRVVSRASMPQPADRILRRLVDAGLLKFALVETIERKTSRITPQRMMETMLSMSPQQLGGEFACDGENLHRALRTLPRLEVEVETDDVSSDGVWSISVRLTPNFTWIDRLTGSGEQSTQHFWLFVEDVTSDQIIAHEQHRVSRRRVAESHGQLVELFAHMSQEDEKHKYQVRVASDRFMTPDVIVALRTGGEEWTAATIHPSRAAATNRKGRDRAVK